MHKCISLILPFTIGCLAGLIGCSTPKHTNTLIFATNTKFALDVSQDPTGVPSITVGYKRQEAVWMPLLANQGAEGKPGDCAANTNCLFQGIDTGTDSEAKDTYSVLASFGAKFSGKVETQSGAGSSGALAQYFATGLAAQTLAKKGGSRLVSIQPADTVSEEIKEAAKKGIVQEELDMVSILSYVNTDGKVDEARLKKLIPGTGINDDWVKNFAKKPVSDLKKELAGPSRRSIRKLAANIKE